MKSFRFKLSSLTVVVVITFVVAGCVKQDFDEPPVYVPHAGFESNVTIAGLKNMLTGKLLLITADTIIEGIITANDESDNLYKTMYLQDGTAGIELKVDKTSLYTEYKVGQRVLIKCKGLYLGKYGDLTQLGYIYDGSIGRIPEVMIAEHIYRDSLPGKPPVPDTLDFTSSLESKLSMLVAVPDVRFPDHGQPFVISGEDYTNRDIGDALGNPIKINGENFILRTSQYASFAETNLPEGKGTLTGILSYYNGQYQLYIRDISDCVKFDTAGIIYEQNFDQSPSDWVTYSVKSNKDWTWDSQYRCMVANGYEGDQPSEDWLVSPAINLAGVTQTILTFRMWTKYTDNGLPEPFEVFISTDYSGSGDPSTATWTTLPCTIPEANSAEWTSSGEVDLSMYQQPVYIGYKYRSSGTTSGTASKWEVDTFIVTGDR